MSISDDALNLQRFLWNDKGCTEKKRREREERNGERRHAPRHECAERGALDGARTDVKREEHIRETRYQIAPRSHHRDLQRATPEVEVRKILAPVQFLGWYPPVLGLVALQNVAH